MILVLTCLLVGAALPCHAQAPATPEALMKKVMTAVENNDYAAFVADGTPEFKAGLTPQMLEGVSQQIAGRMKQGYECLALGELKQQGFKTYLWKMVYKDGGDDSLVRMTMKDSLVAGFWIQ
jgi:hypothetical protein